jgi:hypothetical protein
MRFSYTIGYIYVYFATVITISCGGWNLPTMCVMEVALLTILYTSIGITSPGWKSDRLNEKAVGRVQ